jgi:hypothetical protein
VQGLLVDDRDRFGALVTVALYGEGDRGGNETHDDQKPTTRRCS